MSSKRELGYDLSRLVDAISTVPGVLAAILFGSRARGDYDEYSDYDLLVIFSNDEIMWQNHRELYRKVGELGLFTSVLARSLRELKESTDPIFLDNILKEGKLLYARFPLEIPAFFQELIPMLIVSYSLGNLSHQDKMKVTYRLFGRRIGKRSYEGVVHKAGGMRLGYGSILIPEGKLKEITAVLHSFKVEYKTIKVLMPKVGYPRLEDKAFLSFSNAR